MDILKINTQVKFNYKVWFSQSLCVEKGIIKGYDERCKTYKVLTVHGYVDLGIDCINI